VPSTHSFPPLEPLEPLEPLDELLELLVPLEPLEPLEPPDRLVSSSPQNALRARPHATSAPPHTPSTQAAARYEVPLEQSQHVGMQSTYVEQLAPGFPLPTSFSGFVGQPPLTCSAEDEMFELELEPLELLALPGSDPVSGIAELPPLQATRSKTASADAALVEEIEEAKRERIVVMSRSR